MNLFLQFFYSLYSPKKIASWREQKISRTILFLFLLVLFSIIPMSILFNITLKNFAQESVEMIHKLPDFTIIDGRLSSESTEPVILEGTIFTFIFDPEQQLTPREIHKYSNRITFLKDHVEVNSIQGTNTFHYPVIKNDSLSKETLVKAIEPFASSLKLFIPITIIFMYLFTSAITFLLITIIAWVGRLINKEKRLPYKQLWTMATYSTVLPTVFFFIMDVLQTQVPFGFIIQFGVTMIIFYLAMKEVPINKLSNENNF